ncbi:MAG: hypothetical protein FJW38_19960 [Acidobacteria bacterium]|nr:hypothetical protein [Acidobacteriota bacterium]
MKLSRSEQARVNGAKSKGPKTEQGKEKCAKANITHGAYAARISTLPFEDQDLYAAIWQAAVDQLNPRNMLEMNLVNQYVDWTWRADRFLNAANDEAINRSTGFRLQSQDTLDWDQAFIRTITETQHVQNLEKQAARCTYNAARVLKQLKDLRAFTVSTEESQEYAAMKDKILEQGVINNPASRWELPPELPEPAIDVKTPHRR